MAKAKRRAKKENTVQNKDNNKVIKKCVVKLRRLNNKAARKIDKTLLNTTQEESSSALDEQSTGSEDIFLEEPTGTKSGKLKNCVVKMKNLPGTGISLRTKEVLKPPQVEIPSNPEPASKSPLELVSEQNFKTPAKKQQKVQYNVSPKKAKRSQKVEKETNENDVYEFFSQSSTSEREDPTSDVVQKLIKTGRASVAKHVKGKGRPKASRKRAAPKISTKNVKKIKSDKKPQENPVKLRAKELPQQAQMDIDTSPPIACPVEKLVESETAQSKHRTPVTDKQKLLEVARNFVKQSTPIRTQNIGSMDSPFSPIAMKSPWRPLEEEKLPRVFYFSRNEDNLPSYSSDVIPSSQVVEKSRRSVLNHSDIENVNPNNQAVANNNNNPRKTLGPRSPLKSINIMEIINLPRKSVADKSLIKPLACNKSFTKTCKSPLKLRDEAQQSHNIDPENFSIENCFGFDECLEDQDEETTSKIVPDKSRLIARLKNLQRLCPKKPQKRPQEKVRTIYPKVSKQKDIRDVLSSTIQDNENGTNASNINFNNSADISVIPEEENQIKSSFHLFDDLDDTKPASESTTHTRTYIRNPKKRRHSLYHSDEEEEEEEEVEVQEVKKHKRTKAADAKQDKELEKFVEEFNSMCEEVNQYELLVVKE